MGSGGSLERVLRGHKTLGSGGSLVGLSWVLEKGPGVGPAALSTKQKA